LGAAKREKGFIQYIYDETNKSQGEEVVTQQELRPNAPTLLYGASSVLG
jgi:hypothetical protein